MQCLCQCTTSDAYRGGGGGGGEWGLSRIVSLTILLYNNYSTVWICADQIILLATNLRVEL